MAAFGGSGRTGARNAALDGLRGVAAVTVLGFHAWLYSRADVRAVTHGADVGSRLLSELRIGLVLFFVLSGFLLFRPWVRHRLAGTLRPQLKTYARHRGARILPAAYVAITGSILLLWPLQGSPGVRLPPADQLPLFFVFAENQSAATVMRLNPPLWTLAVEVSFYVVLPLLAWAALRGRARRAGLIAVPLVLIATGLLYNWWLSTIPIPPLTRSKTLPAMLPYFGLGMLAATLAQGWRPSRRTAVLLALGSLALIVLDGWLHSGARGGTELALRLRIIRDLPAAIGLAGLVALAAVRPGRLLAARPLVFLGEVSYGLYLWHVPILLLLRAHGLLPGSAVLAFLVALPCATAAGWLSWRLVERPAIAWSRRSRDPDAAQEPGKQLASVGHP